MSHVRLNRLCSHLSLSTTVLPSLSAFLDRRFTRGKNVFQNIRQRRERKRWEKSFTFSGASSETEEAPERTKRFSTIPFPSVWTVKRLRGKFKIFSKKNGCGSHRDQTPSVVSYYTLMLQLHLTWLYMWYLQRTTPQRYTADKTKTCKPNHLHKKMHQMTKVRNDSPDFNKLVFSWEGKKEVGRGREQKKKR